MDPDEVTLENLTKNFEYVKFSNQIDTINMILKILEILQNVILNYILSSKKFFVNFQHLNHKYF
jgi:hypothetical protein